MKKFTLLLVLGLFLGCGTTHVDTKSSSVSATTADGQNYNFNGDIIVQWYSSNPYSEDETISIDEMIVELDDKNYKTHWSWSKKIKDLKEADIADQEVNVPFNFLIKLPYANTNRSCKLKYKITLDDESEHKSTNCTLPRAN